MHYNTISAKAIIGRTMSSFGIKDQSIIYEALEWIGDGIAEIGYGIGLVNKWDKIEIEKNTIIKPSDLFSLDTLIYNGQYLKYGIPKTTSIVQSTPQTNRLYDDLVTLINSKQASLENSDGTIDIDGEIPCDSNQYRLVDKNDLDQLDRKIHKSLVDLRSVLPICQTEYFWDSEGDCYKTSIDEGEVIISYQAYPVDSEGYPLVIDEMKYKMALEYVVMERLMRGGYKHNNLSYPMVRQEKDLWIGKARNQNRKLNDVQMANFVGNWTNMLFQVQRSSSYYSNG